MAYVFRSYRLIRPGAGRIIIVGNHACGNMFAFHYESILLPVQLLLSLLMLPLQFFLYLFCVWTHTGLCYYFYMHTTLTLLSDILEVDPVIQGRCYLLG